MEHYFDLPVSLNGEEHNFKGRLVTFGYVYKFYIVIEGKEYIFEKDDEQQYRVLSENQKEKKVVDPDLIAAIIDSLNVLSK
ncbi:MAG TPA: hypothetical protein VFQ86_05585 [Arachidicoccus soli]|uniref:Uncharacterized protein n=1 Tax=Arachidicoccus soli TaxID=2341117 RepID=A0A386HPU1_9BACT|nr:hypothetical protein [Arachidicoccus soli]AYD47284.1 hypothetical protein D6B99_06465 [Arachidicoccus soli]HEU0227185.1 hypothetical protein [Arachidicoccus soli]